MPYQFLVDTYETESIKVVSVWSQGEAGGGAKAVLPEPSGKAVTERP